MSDDLLDVLLSAGQSKKFQIDQGVHYGALSSSQILHLVRRYAGNLKGRGVGAGDLVLYQGTQSAQAFILFWATQWLGAIFFPIDNEWPDYAVSRATVAIKPRLIVASGERRNMMRSLFPDAEILETTERTPCEGGLAVDPVHNERELPRPAPRSEESAAVYLFTSGSTALPKVVILSRRALLHGAHLTRATFEWCAADRLVNLPEPHTMSGLRNAFIAAPLTGMVWCCTPTIRPRTLTDIVEIVRASGCTRLVAGPALIGQLVLWGGRFVPQSLTHLKAVYTTGASLRVRDAVRFHERHGIPVVNYYGLTETGGLCVSQSLTGWQPGDRSLGRPVGCTARLVAEDGSVGDYGELQIHSRQLMRGYLNESAQSAQRFAGEWLRTGDIMRRDERGHLVLLGRSDCFIKTTTTERVHPEEVESVLEEHDEVVEAGVVGVMSAACVERIAALVVLRDAQMKSATLPNELAEFVAARLGNARSPSQIQFVPSLPRFANGKLERRHLPIMLA